jgi:hypothetical protein
LTPVQFRRPPPAARRRSRSHAKAASGGCNSAFNRSINTLILLD